MAAAPGICPSVLPVSIPTAGNVPAFDMAALELRAMRWTRGMRIEEVGSPQRIAPYSLAIEADLEVADAAPVTGRLILLHDPRGNDAWRGAFRLVSFARVEMDLEMVADPLLPEVAWSWLTDSLAEHARGHDALAGTVTASYGRSFGELEDTEDHGVLEVRASWTPALGLRGDFDGHLRAWQGLLLSLAGGPPLATGLIPFPGAL